MEQIVLNDVLKTAKMMSVTKSMHHVRQGVRTDIIQVTALNSVGRIVPAILVISNRGIAMVGARLVGTHLCVPRNAPQTAV
jgi:hypothetical protein